MSTRSIGAARLHIAERSARACTIVDFGGVAHDAIEVPALVSGPSQLMLELSYCSWPGGGRVDVVGRGNSGQVWDMIVNRVRLGTREIDDVEVADIELLGPHAKEGGLPTTKKATEQALDAVLGAPTFDLLARAGADIVDSRERLFDDSSKRRGYLAAVFDVGDASVPLTLHVLTRVLPMMRFAQTGAWL